MSRFFSRPLRASIRTAAVALLAAAVLGGAILPFGSVPVRGQTPPDHLVISELVTGGAGASDEFIEIHNPTSAPLPLEGLELVYVSASGLTVSRRTAWEAGAPDVPAGRHALIANEAGTYAPIADAVYASGMAATGGSVALRIQGATSALDAVGWGSAASTWLEGTPAPAPAAGSSLERLPGGAAGSGVDTGDNAADFVVRVLPDPQNSASPPTPDPSEPSPSPTPTSPPDPSPTPAPTDQPTDAPSATPSPGPAVIQVATARAMPDRATVTVEATALSASDFSEGGGYVADASGGIAVLLSSGSYERGQHLRITGTVGDRFAQRTLRSSEAGVEVIGVGVDPHPADADTGGVGEPTEGSLVRLAGAVLGAPTALSGGLAFEIDDGSGAVRVLIGSATGIDTAAWNRDARVELVGVVGQRDSSGTGTGGYRVQPRDPADVLEVGEPAPSATPTATPTHESPSPTPGDEAGTVSIAAVRSLAKNARAQVRGVVTLAPGTIDPTTAVLQDGSGAIVLRLGDEAGPLARGELVTVDGVRSTLQGMETLRVTRPVVRHGTAAEPVAAQLRTGDAGESMEARLVTARGGLVTAARRAGSGSVSFEIDDGSGPLRVFLAARLAGDTDGLVAGAWVEVSGVLGQETTGAQPMRGYRIWPRSTSEVRIGAAPTTGAGATNGGGGGSTSPGGDEAPLGSEASLAGLDSPALASLRVGATLVSGPWPELGLGGVLWDGSRLVVIDAASATRVTELLAGGRPPLPVELGGLTAGGSEPVSGAPLVTLGTAATDVVARAARPDPPSTALPREGARWTTMVGRIVGGREARRLAVAGSAASPRIDIRCDEVLTLPSAPVRVTGIGVGRPATIIVPCGGVVAAPLLGGSLAVAAAAPGAAPAAGEERAVATKTFPDARVAAGALLGVGALLLVAAAVVGMRLDPDPGEADDAPDPANAAPATDDPPSPRILTLVSAPHERGSP